MLINKRLQEYFPDSKIVSQLIHVTQKDDKKAEFEALI